MHEPLADSAKCLDFSLSSLTMCGWSWGWCFWTDKMRPRSYVQVRSPKAVAKKLRAHSSFTHARLPAQRTCLVFRSRRTRSSASRSLRATWLPDGREPTSDGAPPLLPASLARRYNFPTMKCLPIDMCISDAPHKVRLASCFASAPRASSLPAAATCSLVVAASVRKPPSYAWPRRSTSTT